MQINDEQFKKELSVEWVHLVDGKSRIEVQNTGDSELKIEGYFTVLTEAIQITYDILVITIGLVVVVASVVFSIRKSQ